MINHVFSLIFVSTLALAPAANATITFLGADGVSAVDTKASATTPVIFGGIGGDVVNCDATDGIALCNNCGPVGTICNQKRIYPELKLTISFKSDSDIGIPVLLNGSTRIDDGLSGATTTKDQVTSITVLWSTICSNATDGDSLCAINSSGKSLTVGISSDGTDTTAQDSITVNFKIHTPSLDTADPLNSATIAHCDDPTAPVGGVCDFVAYPGDGKIYLEGVDPAQDSFPLHNGLNFSHIRIYFSTEGFDTIDLDQADAKDMSIGQIMHIFVGSPKYRILETSGNRGPADHSIPPNQLFT